MCSGAVEEREVQLGKDMPGQVECLDDALWKRNGIRADRRFLTESTSVSSTSTPRPRLSSRSSSTSRPVSRSRSQLPHKGFGFAPDMIGSAALQYRPLDTINEATLHGTKHCNVTLLLVIAPNTRHSSTGRCSSFERVH